MTTVLHGGRSCVTPTEESAGSLWLTPDEFDAATGWHLETRGLCRGNLCVPLQDGWQDDQGRVDLLAFAAQQGLAVTQDESRHVVALADSVNARREALQDVEAPDFELPDLDGQMHRLSDFRGKKVFLYSWGSY